MLRARRTATDKDLRWHLCNPRYLYDWQCDKLVKMRGQVARAVLARHYSQAMEDYKHLLDGSHYLKQL